VLVQAAVFAPPQRSPEKAPALTLWGKACSEDRGIGARGSAEAACGVTEEGEGEERAWHGGKELAQRNHPRRQAGGAYELGNEEESLQQHLLTCLVTTMLSLTLTARLRVCMTIPLQPTWKRGPGRLSPRLFGGYIEESNLVQMGEEIYEELNGKNVKVPESFVVPQTDDWPTNLWDFELGKASARGVGVATWHRPSWEKNRENVSGRSNSLQADLQKKKRA